MATLFRRRLLSDTWHWMLSCSLWPTGSYRETVANNRPPTGELCNECLAKERLARRY